jgi:hypothetical protein
VVLNENAYSMQASGPASRQEDQYKKNSTHSPPSSLHNWIHYSLGLSAAAALVVIRLLSFVPPPPIHGIGTFLFFSMKIFLLIIVASARERDKRFAKVNK